jgi:sugar lactone lactonase YvrE
MTAGLFTAVIAVGETRSVAPRRQSHRSRPKREVDVVSAESAHLGEGPRYDAQRGEVLWVDILAGVLRRAVLEDGALRTLATYEVDMPVGAAAPVAGGGWLLAAGTGFHHLAEDGTVMLIVEAEPGRAERVRMNDALCDPRGRMLAGSVAWDEAPEAGTLFSLATDRTVTTVRGRTTVSNGLAWSHDGATLWWSDSGAGEVRRFAYDLDTGTIDDGEVFLTFAAPHEGVADGLAIDDEGCLWAGFWGGGCVRRYAPDGRQLDEVRLPATNVTAPCFVGSTLLITTARKDLTEEELANQPLAGRVFAVDVGVGGPPVTAYRG